MLASLELSSAQLMDIFTLVQLQWHSTRNINLSHHYITKILFLQIDAQSERKFEVRKEIALILSSGTQARQPA